MEKYSNVQKGINKDLIMDATKTKLPYKGLLAALLLGVTPVYAADTLTPTLGDNSIYKIVEVPDKGENTITKFIYNAETNKLEAKYYRYEIAKHEYGSGDTSQYYKWEINEDGNREFVELPSSEDAEIIGHYNSSTLPSNPDIANYDTKYLNKTYTAPQTTNPEMTNTLRRLVTGGSVIKNTGKEISINNALFESNNAEALFTSDTEDVNDYAMFLGGGVYNDKNGTIKEINADFKNNTIKATVTGSTIDVYSYGGAIGNQGIIGNINGNFTGNKALIDLTDSTGDTEKTRVSGADGGAIYNHIDAK